MTSPNPTSGLSTHVRIMAAHIKELALLLDNIVDQTRDGAYTYGRSLVLTEDIASAINEIANAMILRIGNEVEDAR